MESQMVKLRKIKKSNLNNSSRKNALDNRIEEVIKLVKKETNERYTLVDDQLNLKITARISQDSQLSQYLYDY